MLKIKQIVPRSARKKRKRESSIDPLLCVYLTKTLYFGYIWNYFSSEKLFLRSSIFILLGFVLFCLLHFNQSTAALYSLASFLLLWLYGINDHFYKQHFIDLYEIRVDAKYQKNCWEMPDGKLKWSWLFFFLISKMRCAHCLFYWVKNSRLFISFKPLSAGSAKMMKRFNEIACVSGVPHAVSANSLIKMSSRQK